MVAKYRSNKEAFTRNLVFVRLITACAICNSKVPSGNTWRFKERKHSKEFAIKIPK